MTKQARQELEREIIRTVKKIDYHSKKLDVAKNNKIWYHGYMMTHFKEALKSLKYYVCADLIRKEEFDEIVDSVGV